MSHSPTVSISRKLYERLKARSERDGVAMAAIVEHVLASALGLDLIAIRKPGRSPNGRFGCDACDATGPKRSIKLISDRGPKSA